jgi:1-acyl-sn-glycerol-3-phosphate acyltransferase
MQRSSQFDLLKSRRFGAFFAAQFFGATTDNLFRNALLAAWAVASVTPDSRVRAMFLSLIFVLPFLLISGLVGQLTDKFEKSQLIRIIKAIEILIVLVAAGSVATQGFYLELVALLLLGVQSALFGPVKYAILPQLLDERDLIGGNGLVVAGTLLAILFGSILGVTLAPHGGQSMVVLTATLLAFAAAGFLASLAIPPAQPMAPGLVLDRNPVRASLEVMRKATRDRTIFLSILCISWFWVFGLVWITELPGYVRDVLGGNTSLLRWVLVVFGLGIATGALFCERLSARIIELGLVPLGALGLTVFPLWMVLAGPAAGSLAVDGSSADWSVILRVLVLMGLTGVSGGVFVVPLYALIQQRAAPSERGRIFAANNLYNGIFMCAGSILALLALAAGLSAPQLFAVVALMNAAITIYIFSVIPEFVMRFIVWILVHTMYRVNKQNLGLIPDTGAAVLVCNHVSYMDALVIMANSPRPTRFVMTYKIFRIPVLNFVFRHAKTIPIASSREDPEILAAAYDRIAEELESGHLVTIFPEGRLTTTGDMNEFKKGIERIVERTPVPVVPLALQGLWGSFFSRKDSDAVLKLPRRLWSRIGLSAAPEIPPGEVDSQALHDQVLAMRGGWR